MPVNPVLAELLDGIDFDPDALREKYALEREKRLGAKESRDRVEVTADFSYFADDPYVEPGFTREPVFDEVEAVVVGGGFGGLMTGGRLREAGFESIRIIDKAGDFGFMTTICRLSIGPVCRWSTAAGRASSGSPKTVSS